MRTTHLFAIGLLAAATAVAQDKNKPTMRTTNQSNIDIPAEMQRLDNYVEQLKSSNPG